MANKKNSGYAVGIDLGTTYSSVAVWLEEYQRVEIIPNERGKRTTPSFVAFNNGRCFIGHAALYQANHNPPNTIYDVKRLIGRKYNDPAIQDDMKKWPFKVIADEKDNPMIVVQDNKGKKKIYSPEQISAKILKKMCEYAETYLQAPVKDVVITVPAYFNDSQRQATKDAGAIAGLNVVRIINEPSAAALAYGVDKRANSVDQDRNIFIFDLGGGSFDVCLVNVRDGVYQVKAKAGNNHLGGEDFVNKMMTHFMQEFKRKSNVAMSGDAKALWKLRTECEKAKKVLSTNDEAFIEIDPLFKGIEFCSEITRHQFEELNKEFFQECMEIVERCFKDAEMDKSSVHDVVLVGGSSRIPKLKKLLRDFFNGKEIYESINLDEAVAYGAAVQAAILSESCTKIPISVLLDVTPLSLGIGIHRDVMDVLIPRNTLFPVKKTRRYYCAIQDNHTPVVLKIYECEDNNFLGSFELTGLLPPPAPRGHVVTVCFEINANGILRVSNNEGKTTSQKKKIVMDKRSRLSDQEISRLIQEGRVDEEEEKKFLEKAIAISDLDKYVCIMETTLNDENISMSFSSQDRENISSAIDKGRELVEGDNDNEQQDIEAVKDCLEEVKSMCESIIKCKIG